MKCKNSVLFALILPLMFASCVKEVIEVDTTSKEDILLSSDNLQNEGLSVSSKNVIDFDEGIDVEVLDEEKSRGFGFFSFNTLNAALHCTGLKDALFSGHKTIYAPSDYAFAKLGFNSHNICEIDTETLSGILLYHVVDETVSLFKQGCLEMINGDITQLNKKKYRFKINESTIYAAFGQGGHGYSLRVYIISEVLTPPALSIVETAVETDIFSSLVAAVLAADPAIVTALSDPDAIFTVFAPTNQAFEDLISALDVGDLDGLVDAIGVEGLTQVLLYHVIGDCAFSNNLSNGLMLTTLLGEDLTIDLENLEVIDATGSGSGLVPNLLDIRTSNGIVHTIDRVLIPSAIQ